MKAKIRVRNHREVPFVEMQGTFTNVNVDLLSQRLEIVNSKNPSAIVLDISRTHFMDSYGLATIVYYHSLLQRDNRTLYILNKNPDSMAYMIQLFEVTKLHKVLNIVDSEELLQPAS
ncbi:MAG: STAS domain-containing protein [Chitinivibrionales bacterium]|nr:STAS domain-containing protein [Chitinivibrionales bacterium]